MGKPEYVRINKTALVSAMTGFKAGIAVHANTEVRDMIDVFEDMVLSYLEDEEDSEDVKKEED